MKRIVLVSLLALIGCDKIVDWGKDTFYQGNKLDKNLTIPRDHIRNAHVYDQFTTRGLFDAMWLSDGVKMAYANVYCEKQGKTGVAKDIFVNGLMEENRHFISFYLLSDSSAQGSKPLSDKNSDWSIILKIGEDYYKPTEIKSDKLTPEYKMFFGKKFRPYKNVYLLKFDARDIDDNYLITKNTKKLELILRTTDRETSMKWDVR